MYIGYYCYYTLDEFLIHVLSDQMDCFILQVPWLCDSRCLPLPLYDRHGFNGFCHSPHLIEGMHVEREVEQSALVVGKGIQGEPVKADDLAPSSLVWNMCGSYLCIVIPSTFSQ